jgi:mannose-6-phosphate isomerase-like protein (cupin superfamily)
MSTDQRFTLGDNVEHLTISELAEQNPDFRRVLRTRRRSPVAIMTIPVCGENGEEVHENTDQILTFVCGTGDAALVGHTHPFENGDQCTVPAGTKHNFRNTLARRIPCSTRSTARPNMHRTQARPPRKRPTLPWRRAWTNSPQPQ